MLKKDKPIKLNKKTELIVTRKEEYTDVFGRKGIRVVKLLSTEDVNLGSLNNPQNTDLIEFEWRDKENKNIFGLRD